jgi:hypothetical protein
MKKIIFLTGGFLLVLFILGLNLTPEKNTTNEQKSATQQTQPIEFLIGAYNMPSADYIDHNAGMNFNVWQNYIGMQELFRQGRLRMIPYGWNYPISGISCPGDSLYSHINTYKDDVNDVISMNNSAGLYSLMQRPKFLYLYSGQSSIYQCEELTDNDYEGFYRFNEIPTAVSSEYLETEYNIKGRKCEIGPNNAGYVVSDVKLNDEFTQGSGQTEMYQDKYYDFFIKPRVKIPPNTSPEVEVFQIEVYGYDNNIVLNEIIKAEDFQNSSGYNGEYRETFRLTDPDFLRIDGALLQHNPENANDTNYFDIRVKWLGHCDMWIDYVKVESDIAEQMFRPDNNFDIWINWESSNIGSTDGAFRFWCDEPNYNMLPCVKYVQDKIPGFNSNISTLMTTYACNPPADTSYEHFKTKANSMNMPEVSSASYPLKGDAKVPDNFSGYAYNTSEGKFGHPVDRGQYETELQNIHFDGAQGGALIKWSWNDIRYAKDNPDKPFYFTPQVHLFYQNHGIYYPPNIQREPTNQEINAMTNIMLTYGAKGILYFEYASFNNIGDTTTFYSIGLHNGYNGTERTKRTSNVYGQDKWENIRILNQKLKEWGKYLIKFDNSQSNSYRYHIATERTQLISNSYIKESKTYPIGNPALCPENSNPDYDVPDIENERYMQIGIFKNPGVVYDKYFMITNRRCSPGDDACSGIRRITVKFNANDANFAGFNNWKIVNLYDNSTVTTFDKNIDNVINLDIYLPGEGKLYTIVPVMQDGGTFVCNESVTNMTFNCNGMVNTGGYNLTINASGGQSVISFKQGCTIQAEDGGDLLIWGQNNRVTLKGKDGNKWPGIISNNSDNVNINNTIFKDVGEDNSALWALSVYNCQYIEITKCTFDLPVLTKAININNTASEFSTVAVYLDTIRVNNAVAAVFVGGSGSMTTEGLIFDNIIESPIQHSNYGILLSNVTSPYVDNNRIAGFNIGIGLLSSNVELNSNIITASHDYSTGIFGAASSTINMGNIGDYVSGENNIISNYGSECYNIKLDNAVFEMDNGINRFQVNTGTGSFNMFGYGDFKTTSDGPEKFIYVTGNCFNGEGNYAIAELYDLEEHLLSLHEDPHNCLIQEDNEVDFIATFSNNIKDTVYKSNDTSNKSNSESVFLYKNLYRNLLKKNYDSTRVIGIALITNYSDSINTPDVISKMYFAASKLDSAGENIQTLKSFLELQIISHPQNLSLVKSANYYNQKCKVRLSQYSSALTGFQDIITQNPYSYEGLVASWDFAATVLLANSGGGFAYKNPEIENLKNSISESEFLNDSLRLNKFVRTDNYDKTKFNQEDRKVLIKSVGSVLKGEREKQIEHVKTMETKLNDTKAGNKTKIKQELENAKSLNMLIKTKTPKDDKEYQSIINSDIEKLNPKSNNSSDFKTPVILQSYELYQNYPNPFNPVTKISFDLPKDAKVKLVIYDILGREVKTLVNNEFRTAGKYITEFNGSNLASGIYFARILVNEGKDFMAVKKMVLVK